MDFLNLSEERRKQLKKQYYFDCTCEHCKKQLKDDLMLAVRAGESKVWFVLLCPKPVVAASPPPTCLWVSRTVVSQHGDTLDRNRVRFWQKHD